MRKGQVAMTDLFISITLFLLLLTFFFFMWNKYTLRLADLGRHNELELLAFQTADLLTLSPGIPSVWEENTNALQVPGLASRPGVLSPQKVNAFMNISYNTTISLLNLDRFELYLLLKKKDHAVFEIGQYPTRQSIRIQRRVVYQNESATLDIVLWQ